MPTHAFTRLRARLHRRRLPLVIGTAAVGCAVVVGAVTGGDASDHADPLGPTVTAEHRDLATTLNATGTLQRSSDSTIAYAGALTTEDDTALPDDSSGGDSSGGDSSEPSFLAATDRTTTTTPSTTTTSSCSPTSTSSISTSTTSSCSPTTTATSTTTSTTSTTTSTTSTTSTTPTTSTAPTPPPTAPGDEPPPGGTGANAATPGAETGAPNGPEAETDGASGGSRPTDDQDGDGDGAPTATLTSVLDIGATADRGTVLYTADDQPVVALLGDLPAWRTLEEGVDDGADVRQLEENLSALGYGDGLAVDDTFTADTAAAVEAWETDLGRDTPDGSATLGDLVFVTTPGDVLGHEAAVGDTLQTGSPVLTLGSEQRIVVADVDATESGGWTSGSTVELEWADGTTTTGRVFGLGRDVTGTQVELTIALETGDTGAGDRRSGAAADVTLVDATRDDVIAVPAAAIIQDDDATAVRVAHDDGPDEVIPVETGLVADGWIEITAGLHGGEQIRLPG